MIRFMYTSIIYCILSVLFLSGVHGQSIFSKLSQDRDLLFNAKYSVGHVEIESILYSLSGNATTRRERYYFNAQQKVLNGQTYTVETGARSSFQNEYKGDSLLIKKTTFSTGPYSQRDESIVEYQYDQHDFLIKQIKTKGSTSIYKEIEFTNDERGNPIKLVIDGGKYGSEVARYDYPNNRVYCTVLDVNNETLSSSKSLIDFTAKNSKYTYNEYGDVVDDDTYKFSYKYDNKGNWVKITRKNKSRNKIDHIITRKISYR